MATAKRHREISETFLEHAEEEFNKGDMLQASEKAWGAVAHYVKSIARQRDWRNRSHDDIKEIAQALIPYTADPPTGFRIFGLLNSLHVNFYEEHHPPRVVKRGIEDARILIDALKRAEHTFPKRRPTSKPFKAVGEFKTRRRRGRF